MTTSHAMAVEGEPAARVRGVREAIDPERLGVTLMHEHIFVRDPELELNLGTLEWDEPAAVEQAVATLTALHDLGVRTVVDLTVVGLGRDIRLLRAVAERVPVAIVASTGYYVVEGLSLYYRLRGPGRLLDGPDPLAELFLRDVEDGIAGTGVRAGMIKVKSAAADPTPDERRVMEAAALAQQETGVPITTHSEPGSRNGLSQQAFLVEHGVSPSRIIIGHCGDSEDLPYLRTLMDNGSTIGMDRFGMEHVLRDERRIDVLLELVRLGYADRMVLSHDAAIYSHATPPSWRTVHAPDWRMDHLFRRILPALRERGVAESDLERMLVENPRRLLTPGRRGQATAATRLD